MSSPPRPEIQALLGGRVRWIHAINSPLGFFVLALLIVETFLLAAGGWFQLPTEWRLAALGAGALLFIVVFFTVVWLVVKHPEKLVFTEQSHLQYHAMRMFGSDAHVITAEILESLPPEIAPPPPAGQLPPNVGNG